uniref:NfeD family protein n=1 Tax=Roseihalotalea indica TaxID=2867963 RepID=A0AA49GKC4_9BACT|nr:NfeD family protein [Tunicatimonas sp. TK19036]
MLDWFAVLILLVVGVLLIVVELIFIPGTTIFGIAGLLLTAAAIIISFINYGNTLGFGILGISFVLLGITLFFSLRTGAWDKLSLKTSSKSRVNDEEVKPNIWKGDRGVALSALRPSGKVEFKEATVEVSTLGRYVDAGTEVQVVDVQANKILVEPIQNIA